MPEEENNLIAEMSEELDLLKEKVETLERHQHLGIDGSRELSENTEVLAKEIRISGAGAQEGGFVHTPFTMADGTDNDNERKRGVGIAISVAGDKGLPTEQINALMGAAFLNPLEESEEGNRTKWDKVNEVRNRIINSPQVGAFISGPSIFGRLVFFATEATPILSGTGTIDGNTLVDSSAEFQADKFAWGYINIIRNGQFLETRRVTGNTSNVVTVIENFSSSAGECEYSFFMPVFLGTADKPYSRLYVGDDIRLGYGSSGGTQVQYIKWGKGSPEGVIPANIGSMFLRRDGGAGTTLYIKEDDDGQNTGWVAK